MSEFIEFIEIYTPDLITILQNQDNYRLRELWANLLAHVYKSVKWSKVAGNDLAPNVFQRRLVSAAKEQSVLQLIERLASSLGIAATFIPEGIMHEIETYSDHMSFLRDKTRVFVMYAMTLAKEFKKRRKESEKNESE